MSDIPAQFTAADLTAINNAIKGGVLKVHFQDRTVEYRSLSEMMQVRQIILQSVYPNGGVRQQRVFTTQGF